MKRTCIFLVLSFVFNAFAFSQSVWDGVTETEPALSGNVYTITNGEELAWVAQQCNNGTNDFASKTLDIAENMDLGNHLWTPIGNQDFPFRGNVEGNQKTIKNLKISSSANNVGLFGYVLGRGTMESNLVVISNLFIENINITGKNYVGGFIGYGLYCKIEKCCVKNGTVSGDYFVGGFAGSLKQSGVTQSYAKADISAAMQYGGGFVGVYDSVSNNLSASYCYAIGKVEGTKMNGGFVGCNQGQIRYSYCVTKSISGDSCGGICGKNEKINGFDVFIYAADKIETPIGFNPVEDESNLEDELIGKPSEEMKLSAIIDKLNEEETIFIGDEQKNPQINDDFPVHKWESEIKIETAIASFEKGLLIYPNPVKDIFYVKSQDIRIEKMEILNLLGKVVFLEENKKTAIDISNLESGVYLLRIYTDKDIWVRKIIKQ